MNKLQKIEEKNNIKILKINKKIDKFIDSKEDLNNKINKYSLIEKGLFTTGATTIALSTCAIVDESLVLCVILGFTSINLCFVSGLYAEKRAELIEELSELKKELNKTYEKKDKCIQKAINIKDKKIR